MGTTWSATWLSTMDVHAGQIEAGIEQVFASTISDMSSWHTGSALSQFNRLPAGQSLEVSEDFSNVMRVALDVAKRSNGAFDPCLGSDVVSRGFGPVGLQPELTSPFTGAAAWAMLGGLGDRLLQPGGIVLDLSGVAKGYAVDRMARVMHDLGVTQFLVEIGGEFVARGIKQDGSPWWVDLENTFPEASPWRVALCRHAVASSGDYRQMRHNDGAPICHIVPHAERQDSFGDLACVSVIHESCAVADAWATALFALGDRGVALADAENLAVLFQYRDAAARVSARLASWLS